MPDSEFVFFEPEDCEVTAWFADASNVSARRTRLPSEGRAKRFLHGRDYWPKVFAEENFDIFEALHIPIVKATTGKTLLTIHDVRGLHPDVGVLDRFLFKHVLGRSLRLADHVVTVSEAMRKEILAFSPNIPVSVIYNGLDADTFAVPPPYEVEATRVALALPERFLLTVGHFEPRKNYLLMIEALAKLHRSGQDIALVIIGNDSGERARVAERIRSAGLGEKVLIFSGLTDTQVRCVYQMCSAFVFASRYEGFGIPLLEAMAASKPLVVSDIPVFREITQDQGAYFNPVSAESIALKIEAVLASSREQSRLLEYGRQRVRDFQFDALAEQVEKLYRSLSVAK